MKTHAIEFKGKVNQIYNPDNSPAWQEITVPVLSKKHCNLPVLRQHPRLGGIANSQLLPAALSRLRKQLFPTGVLRLDQLPEGVTVDQSKFLTVVRIYL